jgi:hypothetical protein
MVKIWVFMCGYAAAYVHSFCMLSCVERHVEMSACLSTQDDMSLLRQFDARRWIWETFCSLFTHSRYVLGQQKYQSPCYADDIATLIGGRKGEINKWRRKEIQTKGSKGHSKSLDLVNVQLHIVTYKEWWHWEIYRFVRGERPCSGPVKCM